MRRALLPISSTVLLAAMSGLVGCQPIPELLLEVVQIPAGTRYLDLIMWKDPGSMLPRAHTTNGSERQLIDLGQQFPDSGKSVYRIGVGLDSVNNVYGVYMAAFKANGNQICLLSTTSSVQGASWVGIGELTVPFTAGHGIDRSTNLPDLCKTPNGGFLPEPIVGSVRIDTERLTSPMEQRGELQLWGWNFHPRRDTNQPHGISLAVQGSLTSMDDPMSSIPMREIVVALSATPTQPAAPDQVRFYLPTPDDPTGYRLLSEGALSINLRNQDDNKTTLSTIAQASFVR